MLRRKTLLYRDLLIRHWEMGELSPIKTRGQASLNIETTLCHYFVKVMFILSLKLPVAGDRIRETKRIRDPSQA